ncbi:MAG: 1-acyl-sn-glycerol-3-phosphate acyltransferase [Chromatiales bacterium]|jgi:1-acyl-sn-glycerol-3-phosphate acyltransferase|nr:MAG: 1-acyl-sn-glycerol-3-phosphate acyltransferase [Chromatiales bacterium]
MLVRSVIFTVLMFLSVLPWSIVIAVGRLSGYPASYALVMIWVRANFWLMDKLCHLNFRVEGSENIPAQNSVVLLKHSSAYETLAQFFLFPRQCWVVKRELLWAPFLGWAIAAVRPIAINRGAGQQAVAQVLAKGKARLEEGHWVVIFPEGTRMPPGETRRYGLSGVLLAQEAGRLLVPVAHDAGDYWPRRGLRKRPGTVTFRIGPAVDPAGREPRQVNEEIQAWVEAQVAELRSGASRS